jgi:hypothetical protein
MKISFDSKPLHACLIGFVAIVAAGSVVAVTPVTRIAFEGFAHFCASGPADVRVTPGGQTLHLRDGENLNQWVTGNALIDGFETNTVIANFTPNGGVIRLFRTLEPDAYPGSTWEIVQTNHFNPNGSISAHGVGHGTGALKGMTIKVTAAGQVSVPNPCSDMNSGVISGVIITPAGNN